MVLCRTMEGSRQPPDPSLGDVMDLDSERREL
jgi:hypothetical protein